jgi:uncharacterized OsmC-like protein
MLISMATFAERHGFDISGTRIDVDMSMAVKPEARIGAIDVTVRMSKNIPETARKSLEKAAAACPIKHSFRPDTMISTDFVFNAA